MATGDISDVTLEYLSSHHVRAILEEALHDVLVNLPNDPLSFLQDAFLRKTPLRLMIVGSLASGKTTQCALLARKYGIRHLEPNTLLYNESKVDSDTGHAVAACIEARKAVPEEVIAAVVLRAINEAEKDGQGWVLDSYPRNRLEAVYLQTSRVSPQKLFYLDIENSSRQGRMSGEVSAASQTSPMVPDFPVYDLVTGIQVGQTPSIVATHVQFAAARHGELLISYKPFYVFIDANQSTDDVHAEICEHINNLDRPV